MKPKKIGVYMWKVFTIMLFIAISALTLFFAFGWQYDFKKKDFKKTSIIDIIARDKEAEISMDGTQQVVGMPYQIKSVLPGEHLLEVNKKDYQLWKRSVIVEEDIVTIVNDVLLVPQSPDKFVKPLADLSGKNEKLYTGKNYIVTFKPGDRNLRLISLFENGTIKEEDVELYKSGINQLEITAGENFLLYFADGGMARVNFEDRRFLFFRLPKQVESVEISPAKELLYFLLNGDLYAVPFDRLDQLQDVASFKLISKVQAYVPAYSHDIYFLSGGTLFKSNFQGREIRLVDHAPGFYKNVDYKEGNEYGALILRDLNDKRYLCVLDKKGDVTLLADDLKGRPFFNSYDQLIYAKNSGEIHFNDPNLATDTLVDKTEGEFEILGWFSDEGHFLIKENGSVNLGDVFNANTYTVLNDIKGVSDYFVLRGSIFYIKEGTLDVMNWSSAAG